MLQRKTNYLFVGILILTLLVTIVPSTQSSQVATVDTKTYDTADFVSKNILFDESHCQNGSALWAPGNASMFSWLLGEHGYTSYTNFDQALDSGILSGYDILVIFFPQQALTAGELAAVEAFVNGGGGLLLVGISYDGIWGFTQTHLNALSTTFDITCNTDVFTAATTTFSDHNVTYELTSWNTNFATMGGCSLDLSGSAEAVITLDGNTMVAVNDYGSGRVVVSGSPGPFIFYRYESLTHGDSHMQFSLNVIDWLSGNPERVFDVPEIAKITVGDGPDLSPTEVEEYSLFTGQYHDHTTHSDGQNTPEDMLDTGLLRGMDFMVMTDHSHRLYTAIEGVTGGQAMRDIVEEYGLDIHITVGAELSSVRHTTGWPLTENIWTNDQQEAIDGIHDQGGMATFCHPGISPNYAEIFENYESYGFDAIEVINSNFFRGEGELGYLYNFMGANDHHSASLIGGTGTAAFVLNPSGPNGQITDADLMDACMNRRIVLIDTFSSMVYGEAIWVDRYLDLLADAKDAVAAAHVTVQAVKDAGNSVSLSEEYMDGADNALTYWNPMRAMHLAANATSSSALGIDFSISAPDRLDPDVDFDLTVQLTNNHTYALSFDAQFYIEYSVSFGSTTYTIDAPAESVENTIIDGHTNNFGIAKYYLYMTNFSTSEYLMPVMFRARNLIENVSYTLEQNEGLYDANFVLYIGRDSS
ncbi:MAG: PHP domain-containing protein, partial [Candidatus Thorarchaeota archaeon]